MAQGKKHTPEFAMRNGLARAVDADYVKGVLPNVGAVYRDSFNALLHGGLLLPAGTSLLSWESERTIPLLLSSERRRCAVTHALEQDGMSGRRACRLANQPRGTQRYQPAQRDDEDALTRAVIELASQYGRHGSGS
jgi:hypothetical protein